MQVFSIYRARNNITGKSYVGFDSNWPNRKSDHKLNYKKENRKFYDALKKYGWNNFEWEVLYQSKDGDFCLNVMEPHFIKENNSFVGGYNMTEGGEGSWGFQHTEQYKKYQSQKSLEQWQNKEFRNKQVKHLKNLCLEQEKTYQFKNRFTEEIITITGLNSFCEKNHLWPSAMIKVYNQKRKYHKEWTCVA